MASREWNMDRFLDRQAGIVCRWLRGRAAIGGLGGMGSVVPSEGLVAFNVRCGDDFDPYTFVFPVKETLPGSRRGPVGSDLSRLVRLTRERRRSSKVKHFDRKLVQSGRWGSFTNLGLTSELEATQNHELKALLTSDRTLEDDERNALDLLYFRPEDQILCYPVCVMGSPLVTCYHPLKGSGRGSDEEGALSSALQRELLGPLSSFVAINTLVALYFLGRETLKNAHTKQDWKRHFLNQVAGLLFAKRSSFEASAGRQVDEQLRLEELPPLYAFDDGVELSIGREVLKEQQAQWSALLPSFPVGRDEKSSEAEDVPILVELIEGQIRTVVEFITDTVRAQEELRREVGSKSKAELFDKVRVDFETGMNRLREAAAAFNVAERRMDPSGQSFLRAYYESGLNLLFRKDASCWWCSTGDMFHFTSDETQANKECLFTIHEPDNVGYRYSASAITAWSAYRKAIVAWARGRNFPFFDNLLEAMDEKTAESWLAVLKQVLHRTQGGELYDVSLLAHTIMALCENEGDLPTLRVAETALDLGSGNSGLNALLSWSDIETHLKEEADGRNPLMIGDRVNVGEQGGTYPDAVKFLGAWMGLVGAELVDKGGAERVKCREIAIVPRTREVYLDVLCEGRLPVEKVDLRFNPEKHGLRSCLKILSEAVGQVNGPGFLGTVDSEEIDRTALSSAAGWFYVGVSLEENRTRFRLKVNRRYPT